MFWKSIELFGWHVGFIAGRFMFPDMPWQDKAVLRKNMPNGWQRGQGFITFIRDGRLVTLTWRKVRA